MGAKLTGDWQKLKKLANNLPKTLIQSAKEQQKVDGEFLKEDIKSYIMNQEGGHVPLKPDTVMKKGHSKTLVETGTLADSFEVEQHGLQITVSPKGSNPSGLSNSELAEIHEYGTSEIPPRPFVRPVYEKNLQKLQTNYEKVVKNEVSKYR